MTDPKRPAVVQHSRRGGDGPCPFCQRLLPLTFHHLIPRKLHRRTHYRRRYSREMLGRGIYVCRDCHDGIHRSYSEMELAARFSSPETLAEDPVLSRHFQWLSRQRRGLWPDHSAGAGVRQRRTD